MAKNTSVVLGDHFEKFVAAQVSSGRYGSASEVLRDGLRLLESEQQRHMALIQALIDGENSGPPVKVDLAAELKRLKARARRG
jgi:antitoxin ParD1/3/4